MGGHGLAALKHVCLQLESLPQGVRLQRARCSSFALIGCCQTTIDLVMASRKFASLKVVHVQNDLQYLKLLDGTDLN